ncbi:hypothetical protein Vadar_021503 [Vaccinium darrowii]|uniref:Uncharacterized protein n=1 Tax=Vaccinium darrowii TaxID=229202 RepID=A0ACB7Y7Y2_9ERIC|nr:hypothetical protein Vadar_021503 [Vaccinium darrowii]
MRDEAVLVAIDKDKSSQYALKWAIDNLLSKGQTVTLLHVKQRPSSIPTPYMVKHLMVIGLVDRPALSYHTGKSGCSALSDVNDGVAKAFKAQVDNQAKELFLPFRAFCTRKNIKCKEIILEDPDVSKVICDFVKANLIEALVVGACSRNGFVKAKDDDGSLLGTDLECRQRETFVVVAVTGSGEEGVVIAVVAGGGGDRWWSIAPLFFLWSSCRLRNE